METKPFNLQSPEQIAKDYGGNKQKIAQAMQMGVIDPTAGTLAGMFIDRMRAAAQQEVVPQQTIAQQTFAPPAPPAPPMPPAPPPGGAGLGAIAPGGAPPAPAPMGGPPMGPPPMEPPSPMGPPPSMASGGIVGLPLPDSMFDEPSNGGYAGGGIVAFAQGGYGSAIEQKARGVIPNVNVTSRQRSAADNARVGGVSGSYHLTGDARDFTPPPGMTMDQLHSSLKAKFPGYDVIHEGDHVHIEPGPGMARPAKGLGALSGSEGGDTLQGGDTPAKAKPSLNDALNQIMEYNKDSPETKEAKEKQKQAYLDELDPETQEKQRKQDMWYTLAQLGFNMASSKSPYVLQAISEAALKVLPDAQATKKERKAALDRAREGLIKLADGDREKAMQALPVAISVWKEGLGQERFEQELGLKREEIARAKDEFTRRLELAKVQGEQRDFYTQKAMSFYANLKYRNDLLPIWDESKGPFVEGKFRANDESLMAKAYMLARPDVPTGAAPTTQEQMLIDARLRQGGGGGDVDLGSMGPQ